MAKKTGSRKPPYKGDKGTRDKVNQRNPRDKKKGGRRPGERGRMTTITQFDPNR